MCHNIFICLLTDSLSWRLAKAYPVLMLFRWMEATFASYVNTKHSNDALVMRNSGALGLAYGGFSYPKETTAVKLGTLELKVQETKTVNIPLIVSAGAIAVGALLLAFGRK